MFPIKIKDPFAVYEYFRSVFGFVTWLALTIGIGLAYCLLVFATVIEGKYEVTGAVILMVFCTMAGGIAVIALWVFFLDAEDPEMSILTPAALVAVLWAVFALYVHMVPSHTVQEGTIRVNEKGAVFLRGEEAPRGILTGGSIPILTSFTSAGMVEVKRGVVVTISFTLRFSEKREVLETFFSRVLAHKNVHLYNVSEGTSIVIVNDIKKDVAAYVSESGEQDAKPISLPYGVVEFAIKEPK